MSNALPAGAAFNPYDSMACCRGTKGTGGECHGDSCPMHLRPRAKAPKVNRRDPVCGAERLVQAIAATPVPALRGRLEGARSHDHAAAEVEHNHAASVPTGNTPAQPSAASASVGKPCPSDCCGGATASFAGLKRPRQAAALTDAFRPRPPTVEPHRHEPSGPLKLTSALRRSHPPRAPPVTQDDRIA